MHGLTIGQLAQQGAVGVETIRFYQRRGLMPTPPRGEGIRRYDDQDVKRLRFIRSAQQAGFTLTQIEELIGLDDRQDRARVLELATARLTEIDANVTRKTGDPFLLIDTTTGDTNIYKGRTMEYDYDTGNIAAGKLHVRLRLM